MSDELDDALSARAGAPTTAPADDLDSALSLRGSGKTVEAPKASQALQSAPSAWDQYWGRVKSNVAHGATLAPKLFPVASTVADVAAHGVSGIVTSSAAGLAGAAVSPVVGNDAAADLVRKIQSYTYEPRTEAGKVATGAQASPWNPGNWVDKAGEKLGDVSADAGAPPIASTGLRILPDAAAAIWGLKKGSAASETSVPEAVPEHIHPGDVPVPSELSLADTGGRAAPSEVGGAPTPGAAPELSLADSSGRGAPSSVGEGPIPAKEAPKPFEPEAETVEPGASLGGPEQGRRQRVLAEIGLKDTPYRKSAVTGDPLEAATDYQLSKLNTEPGRYARGLLDNERQALSNYSSGTTELTGGRMGDTQTDTVARGESVTGALEALGEDFDTRRKAVYAAADERAKGVPTDLKGFQDVLNDDSLMTNQDRVGLRTGLNAYLKKLKLVDDNGNITASVQQAETVRKYINAEWSHQNSKFAGELKDAIDEDVTKQAGDDIYAAGRQIVTEQKNTLDNPKGISDILDSSGPNGINRKVSSDKVMQKLETMPPEQLGHVLDTLRGMKGDLKPQADQAIADIQAHFAQSAHETGTSQATQWNSKGYNQYLKNNSVRLNAVFADKPEVLHRLYTANEAGKILRFDPGYPGAAAQAINIGKSGTVAPYLHRGITMGTSALGSLIGGGPGGAAAGNVVGDMLGGKIARGMQDRAAMKAAQARALTPAQ